MYQQGSGLFIMDNVSNCEYLGRGTDLVNDCHDLRDVEGGMGAAESQGLDRSHLYPCSKQLKPGVCL